MKLFMTLPLAFTALVISTPTKLGSRSDLGKVQDALEARQGSLVQTLVSPPPAAAPTPAPACTCPKILGRCIVDASCEEQEELKHQIAKTMRKND
ncbi:hypothetical protein J3E73DRAFT_370682 [Bipolaris maydis]|nr:hypothetical protein J3E73DRAFT_370682 [Bipolaris maydis]